MSRIKEIIEVIISTYSNNIEILIITIVLLIACILLKLYYPKFRGYMGEFWVKVELRKLSKDKYFILNDIMIKDDKGTHQIDHIVLSKFGIFVIEMKNYYGLIKGNEFDNKWCQYLGKSKKYFINPIHQNYGHIQSLKNLLKIDEKCFISVICFSNQSKIDVKSRNIVIQTDYLNKEILKYNDIIINYDIKELECIIKSNNIVDKKLRKQHVIDIRNKFKDSESTACPKCGNVLVEKNGKYGKFIGCSSFPKCKYIKK